MATPATVVPPTATTAPPTVAPDPTFAGQVVEIVAKDRVFSVSTFQVEAGKPFEVRFENQDPYNHAFYIVAGDAYPADLSDQGLLHVAFRGDYFAGPATMTHHVAALPAGIYTFLCPPHRPMEGTIIVR
ncbi:MAG: cupredoxin domain-containing protein [Chloroflexota bacterium]